jgi:hypothetical protein
VSDPLPTSTNPPKLLVSASPRDLSLGFPG